MTDRHHHTAAVHADSLVPCPACAAAWSAPDAGACTPCRRTTHFAEEARTPTSCGVTSRRPAGLMEPAGAAVNLRGGGAPQSTPPGQARPLSVSLPARRG